MNFLARRQPVRCSMIYGVDIFSTKKNKKNCIQLNGKNGGLILLIRKVKKNSLATQRLNNCNYYTAYQLKNVEKIFDCGKSTEKVETFTLHLKKNFL